MKLRIARRRPAAEARADQRERNAACPLPVRLQRVEGRLRREGRRTRLAVQGEELEVDAVPRQALAEESAL